jgi:hypothetical protein
VLAFYNKALWDTGGAINANTPQSVIAFFFPIYSAQAKFLFMGIFEFVMFFINIAP